MKYIMLVIRWRPVWLEAHLARGLWEKWWVVERRRVLFSDDIILSVINHTAGKYTLESYSRLSKKKCFPIYSTSLCSVTYSCT